MSHERNFCAFERVITVDDITGFVDQGLLLVCDFTSSRLG